jgi:uncharacterized membrane protein YesL
MAGFLGFNNYQKEGPGISKDAPKKKTFIVFFEMFFRNFWKFTTINLVYCLICLPLFTNGMANVGLTHVARNTARDKHSFGFSDFFETIKKNLKQSIIAGVINTIIFALLVFDAYFFYGVKGKYGVVGLGIALAMLITFIMMTYYLWTLIITFDYTLKQAYVNSFKLVFLNIKYSVLVLFVNVLLIAICVGLLFITGTAWKYVLTFELFLAVFAYPAFNALLVQFCTFPCIKKFIIDPYYAEHPDADIDKRQSLGLEIEATPKNETATLEESDEEDDDVIFND